MQLNSDTVFFSGPTISAWEIKQEINAVTLGPVAQGDVMECIHEYRPSRIAIIDGYYENIPAVWHKELLYALSRGIHVYGASSMGALRAAELDTFGMVGIGRIYKMYASGEIEDDDEVAVLHGPKDLGYPALTDAMINLRLALTQAYQENIIDPITAATCIDHIKSIFYKTRSRTALLSFIYDHIGPEDFSNFKSWLDNHYKDQKKADAYTLIEHLKSRDVSAASRFTPNYSFYETSFFKKAFQKNPKPTL